MKHNVSSVTVLVFFALYESNKLVWTTQCVSIMQRGLTTTCGRRPEKLFWKSYSRRRRFNYSETGQQNDSSDRGGRTCSRGIQKLYSNDDAIYYNVFSIQIYPNDTPTGARLWPLEFLLLLLSLPDFPGNNNNTRVYRKNSEPTREMLEYRFRINCFRV